MPIFPKIGKFYIFLLVLSFKCHFFRLSLIRQKFSSSLSTKKLNAHSSFGSFKKKNNNKITGIKFCLKTGTSASHHASCFGMIGHDWTTACRKQNAHRRRLRPSSQCLFFPPHLSPGHLVHLSTNYLLNLSNLVSLLFNKHSSNELNGRLN